MRIYAVADIHSKEEREKKAIELASSSDLAIVCGDITHFGPAEHAKDFLSRMADTVKTLAIPGNCDPYDVLEAIDGSGAINLHKRAFKFNGFDFYGFGGAAPGMIKTIFEIPEEEIYEGLSTIAIDGGILITHVPPYKHLDHTLHGFNIGSKSVLRVINEKRPILNLFGHVHEGAGTDAIGETTLVNCSAGYRGHGCYIDTKDRGVEFLP
jgi:hypothetical protein